MFITQLIDNVVLACDGNCAKAWGVDTRPHVQHDPNNIDDYSFLADNELDEAPIDPGTYEGLPPRAKPPTVTSAEHMNLWCARQCERATKIKIAVKLPDFRER